MYTAVSSSKMDTIIAQLVCTSVSFDILGFVQIVKPEIEPISSPKIVGNKL